MEEVMSIRSIVIAVVAAAIVMASQPARASETVMPPSDGAAEADARVMKIFIYSAYGVGLVGLTGAIVSAVQAASAHNEIRDIAIQNGTVGFSHWACTTPTECARLRSLREEQDAAGTRWAWGTGLAVGGIACGTTFLLLYLLDAPSKGARTGPRLSPSIGTRDAGVQLVGQF